MSHASLPRLRVRGLLFGASALCAAALPLAAQSVSGQVVNAQGVGVVGVDLSFSNGLKPNNPTTGAGGFFNIAVPNGTFDIDFLPPTNNLAPIQMLNVRINGATNLGVITLPNGYALSGSVLTSAGAPIAGANMDVFDEATGSKLFTPTDNTTATGAFSMVVPSGTFTVRGKPPSGLILVAQEIEHVVVNGATAVGAMRMPPGVFASGTVVDANSGAPIANADIDAYDAIRGQKLVTLNDNTNALGQWSVIVPTGLLHFAFDPPAGNAHIGVERFNVTINGATNLGAARLPLGVLLTGTVLGNGGAPVAGADIDVERQPGSQKIYTPNDKTDGNGRYQVAVLPGSYRITAEPSVGLGLGGARSATVVANGAVTVPPLQLPAGVTVSGTIRAFNGSPEPDADLDVIDASGNPLVVPGDNVDAAGHYAMVVPTGTYTVHVKTRKASSSRVATLPGIVVNGPRTLDHQLAQTPITAYFGTVGIPTVAPGGVVLGQLAFVNPTATTQNTLASVVIVDPNGVELPLLNRLPLALPSGAFAIVGGMQLVAPPTSASLLGLMFRYELRFDDPSTGAEQDHDHFDFVVQ